MAETAEIRVKFVFDSNAEKETERVIKSIEKMERKAEVAQKKQDKAAAMAYKAVEGAAVSSISAAVVGFGVATAGVVGFGVAATKAFMESDQQVRKITGTLLMLDRGNQTFEGMGHYAKMVKNDFDDLAIQVGETDDVLVDMYTHIIERGGKSSNQAQDLVEKMAYAGRALPGGAKSLAEGFEAIEMGVVKAKNPVVGLISAMGILPGSAKSVAAQMKNMSIEKQMELAEKAVEKLGAKMEKADPTLGQMATRFSQVGKNFMESVGEGIEGSLLPIATSLFDLVKNNKGNIEAIASNVGEILGDATEIAGKVIVGISTAFAENQAGLKEIAADYKAMWKEVFKDSEGIGVTMSGIASSLIKAFKMWHDGLMTTFSAASAVVEQITQAAMILSKNSALAGNPIAGMVKQSLYKSQGEGILEDVRTAAATPKGLTDTEYFHGRDKYIESQKEALGPQFSLKKADEDFFNAYKEHQTVVDQVSQANRGAIGANADMFAESFKWAASKHNEAAMKQMASFVADNYAMQETLGKAGPEIFGKGAKAFMDALKEVSPAAYAKMQMTMKSTVSDQKPQMNFNNNTFNIKQDFRDQDPDRVAVIFREDLARHATARGQAKIQGPFGGT